MRRPTSRRSFLASSIAAMAAARLSGAEVPWLNQVQMPEDFSAAPKLTDLLVDTAGKRVTTVEGWEKGRAEIRQWWEGFLHPLRVERPAIRIDVVSEDRDAGVIRQLVRYENEPGLFLPAYVLRPLEVRGKVPGIVVLHSTSNDHIRQGAGLGSQPDKGFGLQMARLGCVAICPINYLWMTDAGPKAFGVKPDIKGVTAAALKRYAPSLGMAKMLFDSQRAVDALLTLPGVDAARIGCIGHSLGGKESLYLPAFNERVKASASSEGGVGIGFSNWHDDWYLGKAVKDAGFGHDHHELLAMIAPRAFLQVAGDSADSAKSWAYVEAARPVYELYGKPAHLGLYNHHKGHTVDDEIAGRMGEWLMAYL